MGSELDLKRIGYYLSCELLNGARKTETHLRVHDDCHVSALSRSRCDTLNDWGTKIV